MCKSLPIRKVLLADVRRAFFLAGIDPDLCPPYDLPVVLVDLLLSLATIAVDVAPTDLDAPAARPLEHQSLPSDANYH